MLPHPELEMSALGAQTIGVDARAAGAECPERAETNMRLASNGAGMASDGSSSRIRLQPSGPQPTEKPPNGHYGAGSAGKGSEVAPLSRQFSMPQRRPEGVRTTERLTLAVGFLTPATGEADRRATTQQQPEGYGQRHRGV
jgi:hypothetical protein